MGQQPKGEQMKIMSLKWAIYKHEKWMAEEKKRYITGEGDWERY